MKRMLFNATYAEELRVASVEGRKLINFDIEISSKEQRKGNIYKGVVTRVEASLEACFVDYGQGKQGFLPFKEIDYDYLAELNKNKTKLSVGSELVVQVEKDERGNKGAALTCFITLPGRYSVLMPNNPKSGGISRRIEGDERDELKTLMASLDVPNEMSVILRTAALGRRIEELQWDLTYLLKLWEAVIAAAREQSGAFLIYQESSLVIRSIRDHFSPDVTEVLIDTEAVYTQAKQFMAHVMPNFADRIKLYRDDVPLFSRFLIEHQIESAYSRTVTLPSGGVIVIDHTEALTSIDVNSAKANKGADIEATALLTNKEAAEEIARQLRLRDLGGLVVVDFIDMANPRNQRDVENFFKTQLAFDRARIQMGKLSRFGLLELSRQRLQSSLDESTTISCPRCAGVGSIRGVESTALHILRIIQEEAVRNSNLQALHVQLPIDVATYLSNERRDDVLKFEVRMKVKIILIPNVHLDSPSYKIRKIGHDGYEQFTGKSSYDLVETPDNNSLGYNAVNKKAVADKQPVVQHITPQHPAPQARLQQSKSYFGLLVKKVMEYFTPKQPSPVKQPIPKKPEPRTRNNLQKPNVSANPAQPVARNKASVPPIGNAPRANNQRVAAPKNTNRSVPAQTNDTNLITTPSQPVERTQQPPRPTRVQQPKATAVNSNTPQQKTNPNQNQAKITRDDNHLIENEKLNVAPQRPVEQQIFASSASGMIGATIIQPTVAIEVPLPVEQKVVQAPIALAKIDFGDMQVVSTKVELIIDAPIEEQLITTNKRRYNDIVATVKDTSSEINFDYQLVETKK